MNAIEFRCDLADSIGPISHCWEHTVGSGHAPLALREDWRKQLVQCHQDLGFRHVRFHGLLCDDMGTLVDEKDSFLYSFYNADQIWDFLLSNGMKPFVELSFMPQALASGDTTVFHYRGNVTFPKSIGQWKTLIRKLVEHWVQRYGVEEVRTWFFEVWNEPNMKSFWPGTQRDYFRFYRHTVRAIKEVDDQLQVGGPATAMDAWVPEFLDFCEQHDLPADFISTHHYPTDALGTESEDTLTQLAHSRRSILGEWAPDVHRQARGHPLYYTEWNASSNPRDPLHDEPYTAAVIVKTMMEAVGLVQGYSFWTFTDIFEENYFPSEPFHGGFGLLNLHGIPKPSYRAFELLHRLGTEQLLVDGLHDTVDAWVVRGEGDVKVLLSNHALPRHPIRTENIHIQLTGAPHPDHVFVERIDETHANAPPLWRALGSLQYLTPEQVEQLRGVSQLTQEPLPCHHIDGTIHLELSLPPHAVSAITLQLTPKGPQV